MRKIAFLGAGNMAKAIINGLIAANLYEPAEILVYNHRYEPTLAQLEKETGITGTTKLADVTEKAEILVLAVKPFVFPRLLADLKDGLTKEHLLVSIAAGVTIAQMEEIIGAHKIVRVMPNTPALVGEGMSSISPNGQVTEAEANEVKQLFESLGKAEQVPES
ncbi:MAG TPA: NAD(P)-binding domain-containing protein, partial [Enterococcus casseliflavus]|nr:NAD(P)-binding domain-containing protein [Enterococcus casseliflavus]